MLRIERTKIVSAIVGTLLAIILLVIEVNSIRDQKYADMDGIHNSYYKNLNSLLSSVEYSANCGKAVGESSKFTTPTTASINLRLRYCISDSTFQHVILIDNKGIQQYASFSTNHVPRLQLSDREYFIDSKNDEIQGWYGPYVSRNTGKLSLAKWKSLYSSEYDGLVLSVLPIETIDSVCKTSKSEYGITPFMINTEGDIVSGCHPAIYFKTNYLDTMLRNRLNIDHRLVDSMEVDGADYKVLTKRLDSGNFYTVTVMDKSAIILETKKSLAIKAIIVATIVIILAGSMTNRKRRAND